MFLPTALCLLALAATPINGRSICAERQYNASWGTHTSVTLYNCAPSTVRSKTEIERFIRNLFISLGLTPYGNTQFLYHYAGNGYTSGFSAVHQANGHTDIVIRVDEFNNDMYIDFFSCAPYNSYDLAQRAKQYFDAYTMTYDSTRR